jgi:hypothetical protein
MVKLDVDAVTPFASVTVIDTADEPVTFGVPEMVPVAVLKLKPFTNDPDSANERGERPPDEIGESEYELSAVPANPTIGVVIVGALATVTVAAVEAAVMEMPYRVLVTSTE